LAITKILGLGDKHCRIYSRYRGTQ